MTVVIADELPKVPTVTGMKLVEAKSLAEKHGYTLKVKGSIQDAGAPEGTVVTQMPTADAGLEKGGTVSVEVQAAASEVDVPKLAGFSVKKAEEAVKKLGLELDIKWVAMAETATYVVLNQKPPAGQKLKPGDKVEITVNR
jgi:serine/threonine-protein kinase